MESNKTSTKNNLWQRIKETMFPMNFQGEQEPDEPYIISRVLHFRSRFIPMSKLKK